MKRAPELRRAGSRTAPMDSILLSNGGPCLTAGRPPQLRSMKAPTIRRRDGGKDPNYAGKEDDSMKNNTGYTGRVANTGSQRVEAPCAKAAPAPKGTVRYTGTDLRTGTGGKQTKKSK